MNQPQDNKEKQASMAPRREASEQSKAEESTLKVKMTSVQTPNEQTRQSENLQQQQVLSNVRKLSQQQVKTTNIISNSKNTNSPSMTTSAANIATTATNIMGPPTKTTLDTQQHLSSEQQNQQAVNAKTSKATAKSQRKFGIQKTSSELLQRGTSSDSRTSAAVINPTNIATANTNNNQTTTLNKKDKSVASPSAAGTPAEKQASLKKSRSHSAVSSLHSKSPISPSQSTSSPPKLLHQSNSMQQTGGGSGTKKTTVVTRKIKIGSSTKKKLGGSAVLDATKQPQSQQGQASGGETKKTRTKIIKKVIRKKKISKSGGTSGGSDAKLDRITSSSKIIRSSSSVSKKSGGGGIGNNQAASAKHTAPSQFSTTIQPPIQATTSSKQLKLKAQRSQESSSKPPRPPILLSEAEEQFRWILKPFATAEDQQTWRERFLNLLSQREQAQSDPEKKEPPCMACYTRIPDLVKQVISMADYDEELLAPNTRMSPIDASWLTMQAFCKRCCNNKQQLTGAHLSCLGMRHRGFQLLDLTPQLPQVSKRRILLFECDLCGYARSKKGVSGGDSAVRRFATCLICRRRNWSNQDNPGSLMRKLMPPLAQSPLHTPSASDFQPASTINPFQPTGGIPGAAMEEEKAGANKQNQSQPQPVGVHAICAALFGKQKGIKLIDTVQMIYGYNPVVALVPPSSDQQQLTGVVSEEKKEPQQQTPSPPPPKCDICKVTIKRAGTITVKCCGVDVEEVVREQQEVMEGQDEEDHLSGGGGAEKRERRLQHLDDDESLEERQPDEAIEHKAMPCTKHVHSSCLMERSKWKACITGQIVRGFCRTHESQFKLAMPVKHSALQHLLRANREVYWINNQVLVNEPSEVVDMEVSIDGSHFMISMRELLFEQVSQSDSNSSDLNPRSALLLHNSSLIKMIPSQQQLTNQISAPAPQQHYQLAALSVFEQYLIAKLWFSQAVHALQAPASEELLGTHIELASSHMLFDQTDLVQRLTEKMSVQVPEPSEQISSLLEKASPQEIYIIHHQEGVENVEGELVISQERKDSNELIHVQINKFLSECLQKCSLLKNHLLQLYVRGNEHYALLRGHAMLTSPEKSLLYEEVRQVLGFLEELNLTEFIVYHKLKEIFEVQKSWRAKVREILSSSSPSIETLTLEMRSYRNRDKGIALVQARMQELKRLFDEKPPVEHFIALLNEDMGQSVFDNMQYIERLTQKYLWITEFDNIPQTLQQMQCQPKPVKNLYQTLLLLACQPLRANRYDELLGVWLHSCLWQAHAKSFIALHSNTTKNSSTLIQNGGNCGSDAAMVIDWENNESSQEPMDMNEAIEMDNRLLRELRYQEEDLPRITGQLSKYVKQCLLEQQDYGDIVDAEDVVMITTTTSTKKASAPTRMFFIDQDIDELLSQPCANPADFTSLQIVYDKGIFERVWHRADYLRKLKAKIEHVAQECHQIDEINEYIKECKAQTNFDLTHQANVAREKLCLMQDALKIGQINNQEDQGLVASEVYFRVQQLKERQTDKIQIPADLEMMLQAKVQISEKLRRDFYDILEKGKGADSFNKEQMQNLRNIVQKATKDHGLQMEQENKIVDNLKNSEAWLDSTFRSLRSTCGPSLNQIDFKDFQQLHSIFQSAKDCELLLKKHCNQKMDNLVGAAKNLYISLLRAKWLFDVKNLMDKATGTKDLAQLLCLYNRSKELDIDFDKTSNSSQQEQDAPAIYNLAKQRLHDQHLNHENLILKEFSRLGQVSCEFDKLFGTHLKIIQTLERHEKEETMEDLKRIVEKLQADLQQSPSSPINETAAALPAEQQPPQAAQNPLLPPTLVKRESQFNSRVFAISTANELEILTKVRDYIRLNENYNEFMLLKSSSSNTATGIQTTTFNDDQQQAQQIPTESKITNETEVVKPIPAAQTVTKEESKVVQIDITDRNKVQKTTSTEPAIPLSRKQSMSKQDTAKKQKISYQKAMELQRQAREQHIPDDIPVLKRLNQSVLRFEKFRRLCTDYYRFREKIKQKGAELLISNSALIGQKQENRQKLLTQSSSSLQQANSDTKFSIAFLKRLLLESEEIEIEIPKEHFNKEKILEEMTFFQQWKLKTEQTLKQLEKELNYTSATKPENLSQTDVITEATRRQFEDVKLKIKELPVFDNDTFMRIQAFEWLLKATSLIQGQPYKSQLQSTVMNQSSASAEKMQLQNQQSQRIYSLTFWEQLFRQHENYLKVLPMLEDHPIIQNILWEMDRAKSIVEYVKMTKKRIQSNQGKFLSDRYYNYVAFKDKQDPVKMRKLLEQAQSTRVDIGEETSALKEWLRAYERYTQMNENGTLYTGNNYERIKQIYKNIYLSPLDFGELYFEIGTRLESANDIKADIKLIIEENQIENSKSQSQNRQRISLSRYETDLNHFRMNCQIPGVFEIERVIKQIQNSRATIKECKNAIMTAFDREASVAQQIEALEKARKIQCQIEIDMESEETEIRKLIFQKNLSLIQGEHIKIKVEQFRAMQQEYRQFLKQELSSDMISEYKEFSHSVTMCLKLISKCPDKDLLENEVHEKVEELCPQVDFEQLFMDKAAQLYHMQSKHAGPFGGIGNLEHSIEDDEDDSEEGEAEMSEEQSESESQGSLVSRGGKDSRNVSSSSESDSNSGSSSSSSRSSSSSESSQESKRASNESSSSGESEKVFRPTSSSKLVPAAAARNKAATQQQPTTASETKQVQDQFSSDKKNQKQAAPDEDDQMEAVGEEEDGEESGADEEGGESEQEENAESGSKEEASDPSAAAVDDSQKEALANRRPKRKVKANKMDDHIYYQHNKQSGNSTDHKPTKRRKLLRQDGSSESVERASKSDDEDDEEREKLLRKQEQQKKKRQLKKERKDARLAQRQFERQKERNEKNRDRRKRDEMSPMDSDMAFNIQQDQELQSRLKSTQDRIRNQSKTKIYDTLAKFDKKFFTVEEKSQEKSDSDLKYKLLLKAVMQQIEGYIYSKNSQVGEQYQTKIQQTLVNLNLLLSEKYRDLAELFFVRKTVNLIKLNASCVAFSEFIEKINQQRIERRQRHMQLKKQQSQSQSNVVPSSMSSQNQNQLQTKHTPITQNDPLHKVADNSDNVQDAVKDKDAQKKNTKNPENHGKPVASGAGGGVSSPEGEQLLNQTGKRATLTRHDSQASFDSRESNQAKFSDDGDEYIDPRQLAENSLKMVNDQASQKRQNRHRGSHSAQKVIMPVPVVMQVPQFKYNPYSIVQATKQQKQQQSSILGGIGASIFSALPTIPAMPPVVGPSKTVQILYNPIKSAALAQDGKNQSSQIHAQSMIKIRTVAAPGSLLKVWEGTLDVGGGSSSSAAASKNAPGGASSGGNIADATAGNSAKNGLVECQLFSVGEIRQYQGLPEFPTKLTLKGKSKIADVTAHFKKLRYEMAHKHSSHSNSSNMLLKGWVTRKNLSSQDNSDKYTKHYELLEQTQRCDVFTLFEGVSVYLIPITSQTKDFCRQMGIYPLKGKDQQQGGMMGKDGTQMNNPEENSNSILDETHYYAFLSQVRQSFNKRSSYQNPEVICHAHEMPKIPAPAPVAPIVAKSSTVQSSATLKNEKMDWSGGIAEANKNAAGVQSLNDPRSGKSNVKENSPSAAQPTTINLIQAAPNAAVIKSELTPPTGGYSQSAGMTHQTETIYVADEDDARIDALIEKFRAQDDPNIDEIQRELKPLLDSQESVRREEKLVNFLKETIAKVQNKQQRQNNSGGQVGQDMHHHNSQQMPPYSTGSGGMQQMGYDAMSGIPPPQQPYSTNMQHSSVYSSQQQQQHSQQDMMQMQQPPYGGTDSNNFQQQRYDTYHPGANTSANYHQPHHHHQMPGRGPPPPQFSGPHDQMPGGGMLPPMGGPSSSASAAGPATGHHPPPFMRLPPTSFPQQPSPSDHQYSHHSHQLQMPPHGGPHQQYPPYVLSPVGQGQQQPSPNPNNSSNTQAQGNNGGQNGGDYQHHQNM